MKKIPESKRMTVESEELSKMTSDESDESDDRVTIPTLGEGDGTAGT